MIGLNKGGFFFFFVPKLETCFRKAHTVFGPVFHFCAILLTEDGNKSLKTEVSKDLSSDLKNPKKQKKNPKKQNYQQQLQESFI